MPSNTRNIVKNCENVSGRFQGVDFNINARYTVALLENGVLFGQKGTQRDAKELLRKMAKGVWQVRAGGHEGGIGGGAHGADPYPHITLRVENRGYHLHYKVKNKQIQLVDITS